MAKWIRAILWWLVDSILVAAYSRAGGFTVGGVITTSKHPPPSADEIEQILRQQIARQKLADAERERFFFEGDSDEFNT